LQFPYRTVLLPDSHIETISFVISGLGVISGVVKIGVGVIISVLGKDVFSKEDWLLHPTNNNILIINNNVFCIFFNCITPSFVLWNYLSTINKNLSINTIPFKGTKTF